MSEVSTSVDVVVDDLESNPQCFHGPTLLFRQNGTAVKEYYACSACRDRRECPFYVKKSDVNKMKNSLKWVKIRSETVQNILSKKPYKKYLNILKLLKATNDRKNTIKRLNSSQGKSAQKKGVSEHNQTDKLGVSYCYTCDELFEKKNSEKHEGCKTLKDLTEHQLRHPTEILIPEEDSKTYAQYFFSTDSVKNIVLLLSRMDVKRVLCIGAPRIHEHLMNEYQNEIKSVLLDIDLKYYNFYSPKKFIWYNMFNNYVLKENCLNVLEGFLQSENAVVVIDPPFGGRVEPLTHTLKSLNKLYQTVNGMNGVEGKWSLHVMWIFPYFMERHIRSLLPDFRMFDLRIDYVNHRSFTSTGSRKRKHGSPVRIFTNVPLSRLSLDGVDGYRFCSICDYWVSEENKHCDMCNGCTSKNGQTYVHCYRCSRCVKPSYRHCNKCQMCTLPEHECDKSRAEVCYHCHEPGHKKRDCLAAEDRHEIKAKKRRTRR